MSNAFQFVNDTYYKLNEEALQKIAEAWVNISAEVKPSDSVMIIYDPLGAQLAKEVGRLCAKIGARVWYRVRDLEVDSAILAESNEKDIARYFAHMNSEIMEADAVFMIRANLDPNVMSIVPQDKLDMYNKSAKPVYIDYRVKHTNWNLIYMPVKAEADLEGMDFDEYVETFVSACNQPWEEIAEAQSKIVEALDQGSELVLIANPDASDPKERTEIHLSIEGMQFVNSTIKRNFPGAEVFSAPVIDSVNGQLFGKGKYMLGHDFKIVEDVYLRMENGVIVEATARVGEKDLIDFLDRDEGARRFGEIAFGTNPGLRKRMMNPLLNEKVGGSFHITPGSAYTDEKDGDRVIHIDNGNRSVNHWDITIPMLPEYGGGSITLDGKLIQENGRWLIPGTDVLNVNLD